VSQNLHTALLNTHWPELSYRFRFSAKELKNIGLLETGFMLLQTQAAYYFREETIGSSD
jgi:hypothetical protein